MKRVLFFLYGVTAYAVFFGAFLHVVGFTGNLGLIKTIDQGPESPPLAALSVNLLLLGLFGLQHSMMARRGFKQWWTRIVPEPVERSTYVLISSLLLFFLIRQWRPIQGGIWDLADTVLGPVLSVLFWAGWLIVFSSTFMINHFDLFGLRQVYLYWKGREYTPLEFTAPGFYRYVRHPLMLGFLIVFWSSPQMTWGRLIFAAGLTVYILIALQLEEKDLKSVHGDAYENYRKRVSMLGFPLAAKDAKIPQGRPE